MSDTLARKFHSLYELLAPTFGYGTRADTKEFDPESQNGRLMIAVCNGMLGDLQAENAALKVKADRWDEVLKHVGAERDSRGRQDFVVRGLDDSRLNLMKGSVAEHFTNVIDRKLEGKP